MSLQLLETPGNTATCSRVRLFGLSIDNLRMQDAVEAILQRLDDARSHQVCFVNADCVNLASRDAAYRRVFQTASLVLADGIGMKLAGLVLRQSLRDNVNGTDLFPRLCAALDSQAKRVYLLGAQPGVADGVAQWIVRWYPGVRIVGVQHGYFESEEESEVIRQIRDAKADILLVALGAPRQDLWICEHLETLGVKVAMGVGGLFEFYSGRIPRAPVWLRRLGMEWAYRLWREPRRLWRRYLLGNPLFLARLARIWVRNG
jgi:N-acetylglucosaminyldiphosphoundecaprenol N-acetyl-beta-D-mannosaminyltransferase